MTTSLRIRLLAGTACLVGLGSTVLFLRDARDEAPPLPALAPAPPPSRLAVQVTPPPEPAEADTDHNSLPIDAARLDQLREQAKTAPEQSLAWCLAHVSKNELPRTVAEVLAVWSQSEPKAALTWLLAPGRPVELLALEGDVLFNWAEKAAPEAAAWLVAHPDHMTPENLRPFFGAWMLQHDGAAVAWALGQLEPVQREGILPTLLSQLRTPELLPSLLEDMDREVTNAALLDASRALSEENPALAKVMVGLITPSSEHSATPAKSTLLSIETRASTAGTQ